MKLKRKHIGKLFDCRGADGSWVYQLIDIRDGELLLYSLTSGLFEIESRKHKDWRRFRPQTLFDAAQTEDGWKKGRRTP